MQTYMTHMKSLVTTTTIYILANCIYHNHTVILPLVKYGCHITHASPTALLLCSTYAPRITSHITQKNNKLQHLLHKLLLYMYQLQIFP